MSICRTIIIIKELQWMKEESIHRKVLHRLFEEELPKDLLTVLGHLVLLWFTVNTHILSVLYSHTAALYYRNNITDSTVPAMVFKGQNNRVV